MHTPPPSHSVSSAAGAAGSTASTPSLSSTLRGPRPWPSPSPTLATRSMVRARRLPLHIDAVLSLCGEGVRGACDACMHVYYVCKCVWCAYVPGWLMLLVGGWGRGAAWEVPVYIVHHLVIILVPLYMITQTDRFTLLPRSAYWFGWVRQAPVRMCLCRPPLPLAMLSEGWRLCRSFLLHSCSWTSRHLAATCLASTSTFR
jgi:hypothetical protein